MSRVLDRKLWRDLWRLKSQALAVSLVIACGVATLILALGAYRSLEQTRTAYYDRYRFPDIFASATRVPRRVAQAIEQIPGVSDSLLRIRQPVLLDMPDFEQPVSGTVLSLPDEHNRHIARLYLRAGRLPLDNSRRETAVLESFAQAQGLSIGDTLPTLINGRLLTLTIVGIVLSPEYIYAMGPGDMVPDPARFAVLFLHEQELGALYDMQAVYNDITLTHYRHTDIRPLIEALDALLEPYGGTGAHARDDQLSHAFLDNELIGLKAMTAVIPPIFLLISAFLVNMIMTRLISLEREHIGLLKALGFSAFDIASHYARLVMMIASTGFAIGAAAGTWLGQSLTRLYGEFFSFPFLLFDRDPDLYLIALIVSLLSALLGAARAITRVVRLPPAEAMHPAAPTRYRARLTANGSTMRWFSQLDTMAFRHLLRWPVRTLMTLTGIALSVALLVTALFTTDSVDAMIDTIFFQSNRQDATLAFGTALSPRALEHVLQLPGVLHGEGLRSTPVILHHAQRSKRLILTGVQSDARLVRPLDHELQGVTPPSAGVLLPEPLADWLGVRPGDVVEIELLERGRDRVGLTVVGLLREFAGLTVLASIDTVHRLLGQQRGLNGVHIAIDPAATSELYAAVKQTPAIAGIALLRVSLARFRQTIAENIRISRMVYVTLAVIITIGVVYNSARIQLSERARELASLRVLGFTRSEVSSVLVLELVIPVLLAQPLGWLIGYGFSRAVIEGFDSDLFRLPFVIHPATFGLASLVVLSTALVSVLIVRRRIDRLDMIKVLKTRE